MIISASCRSPGAIIPQGKSLAERVFQCGTPSDHVRVGSMWGWTLTIINHSPQPYSSILMTALPRCSWKRPGTEIGTQDHLDVIIINSKARTEHETKNHQNSGRTWCSLKRTIVRLGIFLKLGPTSVLVKWTYYNKCYKWEQNDLVTKQLFDQEGARVQSMVNNHSCLAPHTLRSIQTLL